MSNSLANSGTQSLSDITAASSSCFRDQGCVATFWPSCCLSAFVLLHSDLEPPFLHHHPSPLTPHLPHSPPPGCASGAPCGGRSDGDAAAGLPGETSPVETGGELSESTARKSQRGGHMTIDGHVMGHMTKNPPVCFPVRRDSASGRRQPRGRESSDSLPVNDSGSTTIH